MKHVFRFISILLCVCILCAVCIHADDQAGAIHAVSLQGDTATVSVTAPKNCTIAAALYSADGQMQAIGTAAITGSQTQQSIDAELIGRTDEFDTMKVFLLDLISGMPLCGHLTKTAVELQLGALNLPAIWKEELTLAGELGLPMDKTTQKTVSGQEWAELLDWLVAYADESKLSDWQTCFPALRTHKEALTRFDAMGAMYLAAQSLGNGWAEFKSDPHAVMGMLQFPWNDYYFTYELVSGIDGQKFPVPGTDELQYLDGACLNFNFSRPSGFSGEYPFFYDVTANSIHENDLPTYAECLLAIVRFIASEQPELFGTVDPTQPDDRLLTKELIDRSHANPTVTAENHPQWNGFVLGWDPDVYYSATPDNIRHIADWGFNSLRVMIDYRNLFDAEDVTIGNPAGLRYLDSLIATAIANDLHLNLCLCKLPGRCAIVDPDTYTSTGEFDLFINEVQQDRADHIWSVLAARYRDVSNANLSITPFWEALNYDLSTGLPYEEYTPEDVGAYLAQVIDVIRAEDPDRLIIYEPTALAPYEWPNEEVPPIQTAVQDIDNLMISFNSGEAPYNYAAMTATEGEHIDNNNHSIPLPSYPTYYYSANPNINRYAPMTLDGFLPAGTRIDLYLDASGSGTITVAADENTIFNGSFSNEEYNVGYSLSRYYPYATSDTCISITLPKDTDLLTISTNNWFTWSGMDVILPEAYAIDQWWYITPYDVFLGLEEADGIIQKHTSRIIISPMGDDDSRKITIHKEVFYTTETIHEESSAETIRQFCENVKKLDENCILRTEPEFVGVVWDDWAEYLNDLYTAFTEYGFSWWSNEFWAITNEYPQTKLYTGNTTTKYDGFSHFNLELLQLLQSYTKPVDLIK